MLTLTEQERRQKERLIEQLRKLGVEPDIKSESGCPGFEDFQDVIDKFLVFLF